jgi:hypothetical protein
MFFREEVYQRATAVSIGYVLYEKIWCFTRKSLDDLKLTENVPNVLQNSEENGLPKYLSFRICAIRETFEECGILLCKTPKQNSDTNSNWALFIGKFM